jgi:phage terminase small subunit
MPRERSPSRDKAKEMYLNSNGGMKLKDIAAELGVLDTQIRKWKSTDKWDNELKGTLPKEKRNVTNKKGTKKIEPKLEEVEEIMNSELNDKQRLFCIYYIKCFNATKAYQKAYGCSYQVALVNGSRLLGNAKVKEEITKLKADKLKGAMLEPGDVLQKYIDIAFSDITEYVEFGQEEIPVMTMYGPLKDKETGEIVTKLVNTVKFKESVEVDGTIISEVKQGKDGASIKLQDKMKALDWLANHMDLLDTATKEKLDIEKQKLEIAKIKAGNEEEEEFEDDGFMEALKGEVAEVWADESTD